MSRIGTHAWVALLALSIQPLQAAAQAGAQERLFPAVPSFELPAASPRVHGLVGRLLSSRRGDSRFGRATEAEVSLGENLPLVALRRGDYPITLGGGSQVYGRFSLSDSKTSLISSDWIVGINTTLALRPWDLTLELTHESSHLGDEYIRRFEATRLDWSRETAAAWASYSIGPWRATGTMSYALIDELRLDPGGAALGLDYRGRARRVLGGSAHPVAGLFLEAAGETRWRVSTSLRLGIAFPGRERDRELAFSLIAHDGLSTQRQFFREPSRYLGAELRLDL